MGVIHRSFVSYLFQSGAAGRNAAAYVFSRDGLLRVTGEIRKEPPNGYNASWGLPFVVASRRCGRGPSPPPYPVIGGIQRAFLGIASRRCAYLALDDSGARLGRFTRPRDDAISICPEGAAYVVGGPRGFGPWRFSYIMKLLNMRAI